MKTLDYSHILWVQNTKNIKGYSSPTSSQDLHATREVPQAASGTGIALHLMLQEPRMSQWKTGLLQSPGWTHSGFEAL